MRPAHVGIAGFARTGKSTATEALGAFKRASFAGALRDLALTINPDWGNGWTLEEMIAKYGWDKAKGLFPEVREYLKLLGNGARRHLGEDVWVNALFARSGDIPLVIDDVRFPNEAKAIQERGGIVIRLHRPGVGPESDFERFVNDIEPDFEIHNNGTVASLHHFVRECVYATPDVKGRDLASYLAESPKANSPEVQELKAAFDQYHRERAL